MMRLFMGMPRQQQQQQQQQRQREMQQGTTKYQKNSTGVGTKAKYNATTSTPSFIGAESHCI
jgi:transcription initiation factor TFIID subunit TAF12